MWAIFALAAALLTSFNPILYKRLLGQAGPVVVVWGVIGLALPLLALTTFALTPGLPQVDGLFVAGILASATLNVLAHLASACSLKLADATLVTPLLTFSPVFTVLVAALLLGERPGARGLLGLMLVLVGAYGLNRGPGGVSRPAREASPERPGSSLERSEDPAVSEIAGQRRGHGLPWRGSSTCGLWGNIRRAGFGLVVDSLQVDLSQARGCIGLVGWLALGRYPYL